MITTKVWEIDFYSRPILDEQQKKVWELLVCDTQRTFEFTKFCAGSQANARWLQGALEEAMVAWQQQQGLTEREGPEKIRFFRRQMNNIISRACDQLEIPVQPSHRTFALHQWLQERTLNVYPQHPGFQPLMAPPPTLELADPQPLPEALIGQSWSFVTLPMGAFAEMEEWDIGFGDAFPLELVQLAEDVPVPGLIIFSQRSTPIAGWMSGLELSCLKYEAQPQTRLILETGISDRWILENLRDPAIIAEAEAFETTKQKANKVHFIAVQSDPRSQSFAGFWLLQELALD